MKITCIGAGYVGGPTMAMIADKSPHIEVCVVDTDKEKIKDWNSDSLPIYEPGLEERVLRTRGKNLHFFSEIDEHLKTADIIFISVGTPTKNCGEGAGHIADLSYIESAARMIAKVCDDPKIVVEKSTVPVRTAQFIESVFQESGKSDLFEILSNPEFLSEGTAMQDLENPDRVLIGGRETEAGRKAVETLSGIYENWVTKDKIVVTNVWSAELSKLVANSFLAQRVSSINAISALCEKSGADVEEIAHAIGRDRRIGPHFLKASVGFGGSCFQKDLLNLVYLSEHFELPEVAEYWRQVMRMNDYQKSRFTNKVIESFKEGLKGKKIGILGFAFKQNTNDTRETPAIEVCRALIEEGAILSIYDPKVSAEKIKKLTNSSVNIAASAEETAKGAHALLILTEWDEFKELNFEAIYDLMEKPASVFDGRNIIDIENLKTLGFKTYGIGKPERDESV